MLHEDDLRADASMPLRASSRGLNHERARYDKSKARSGCILAATRARDILMEKRTFGVIVTIAFSAIGVLGDYLLKRASVEKNPMLSRWFYLGFVVYASTALGWVYVMRHLKLATIGVVYSVSMILLLTTIGVLLFREPLNRFEFVGLAMAVGSLILLIRFA
jgi:small multidrug resistance pump